MTAPNLPPLEGRATLDLTNWRSGITTIQTNLRDLSRTPSTIRVTATLAAGTTNALSRQLSQVTRQIPVTLNVSGIPAQIASLRSQLQAVNATFASVVTINTSGLVSVQAQINTQIGQVTALIAQLRALGGSGGAGGGSGRGGSNALSASTRQMLADLQALNNEYKRGDIDAATYAGRLSTLQASLRVAASSAAAGTAEFKALDAALTRTSGALRGLPTENISKIRTELTGFRAAFDAASAGATSFAQKQATLSAYRTQLEATRTQLTALAQSGTLTATQLGQVNRLLGQTARELNTINGKVNIAGLSGNISNALQQLVGFVPGLGQVTGLLPNISSGLLLAAAGAAAFAAGLAASFRTAAEFQQTMVDIKALTQPTAEGFQQLSEAAKTLGGDLGVGPRESAKAILELNRAGLTAADTINGGLVGALNLSGAAGIDAAKASNLAAAAMTAFKLSASDLPAVADTFANFSNKTFLGAEDLSQAIAAVGPVARTAGLGLNEFSGYMATLAQGGFKAMSDAGTSLKTMLLSLQAPSTTAAGALEKLKLNVYDATGNMRPMAVILEDLRGKLKGLTEQQKNGYLKDIFGTDGIRAATILLGESADAIDANIKAMGLQGEAARVARERMDTYQGATKQLGAAFDVLKITIGEKFLPVATAVVRTLGDGVGVVQDFANGTRNLIPYVVPLVGAFIALRGAAIAAAAPAIWAALITAVGGFFTTVNVWVASNPFGAIALAVSALAAVVDSIMQKTASIYAAVDKSDQESFDGLIKKVGELTKSGTEIDKVKAKYLLAISEMQAANQGTSTGVNVFGERTYSVDPEAVKRSQDRVAALRVELTALETEQQRRGTAPPVGAGGVGLSPEQTQKRTDAIAELRAAIEGKAFDLKVTGLSDLNADLAKLGRTFDELREKASKPFAGNLNNTELKNALADLGKQQALAEAATRKKYADEAVKISRDSALAAQKAEIDAMQEGAAKKAALRQLKIDSINKETSDKVKSLGDFPKRQAEVESSGRRQVAALRSKWAQDDLTIAEQNGQKIADAEKLGRDASIAALEDGRTKTQLIRQAAIADLQTDIQRRVEALKGYPAAQGKIEAEGRKQVAALQAGYLREDLATVRQNSQAVSEAQKTARDATIGALSDGLTKEKLLRAAALSDLEADIAKRVEALKGYPVTQAKIETEGRKQVAALQAGWRREDVQKAKENAQAVADAQKSARDATIGALADGQGKEQLLRNAALSDLQADIAKRVDTLKGYPAQQRAIESAGQQEIRALRAGWVQQDRKAFEEAQKSVLEATKSSRDAAVANVQDEAVRRQLSRENELSDLQISLTERVAALKQFPELQRQIEEQGARDLQNLREKHRQEDETDAKARTARILKGWQDANAAVQAAQLAGLDEQSAAYELGLSRQLEAVRGNALATAQLESQAIQDRSRLTEQKASEQAQQERARLDENLRTALQAEGLSDQERLALKRKYTADVTALDSKTHTDSLQRIAQREAAEIAATEKIRLARVALASQPIEEAANNIAALGRQQQLAESTAQKLALEVQMVAAYQQQGAAIAGVLSQSDQLKLTDAERKSLGDKLTESAQNVALANKQVLEYQKQITGQAQEIVTLYGKLVTLTGSESGVVLAQREFADATADVAGAFQKAGPYLEQFRNQRLKPDDFDPAKTALTGLISTLEAQRQKLEALRGEYTKQRDALASIQDVLKGFGVELGDKNLLNNAITFNQTTYDQAKAALDTLLKGGQFDAAQLAEATKGLQSNYSGLKDAVLALGEARAKEFEGERDRIQKESDARKKVLDAQIANAKKAGVDTTQLEAARDRLVNGTEQQVAALEAKAAAARKSAQDAFAERTKGIQELLSGVQQGAASAGKAVDSLGQQVKTNEQQVKDSAARMKTSLQGAFSGLSTQAGQEGRRAGEQFVTQLQAQLKTLKLPSLTGNAGTLTLPSTKAATTYNTITVNFDGKNVTGTTSTNFKDLLKSLANEAEAECRRRNT